MKHSLLFGLSLFTVTGCGDSEEEAKPANQEKPAVQKSSSKSTPSGGHTLSDAEYELLESYLTDIRAGVREYKPDAVGICTGHERECKEFVGATDVVLPPGKFGIGGEFQVPQLKSGEGWLVQFELNCTITKKTKSSESKTTNTYSKEYRITHTSASSGHGYRLAPVKTLTSPSSLGTEECVYTFTAPNLGEPRVWTGTYTIPYKG